MAFQAALSGEVCSILKCLTQALASLHWPRLALLSKRAGRTTAAILGT